MAFDDFASADDLTLGATPDPSDEDLFDFPDMVLYDPGPRAVEEPAAQADPAGQSAQTVSVAPAPSPAAAAPSAKPAPVAAPAPAPIQAAASGPAPATAPQPATETSTATATAPQAYDPELDEDIFNFAELFTAGEVDAGNDIIPAAALFEEPERTEEPESRSAAQAPVPSGLEPAAAPPTTAASPKAPVRPRRSPYSGAEPPQSYTIDTGEENPFRNRLVVTFIAGFLITNAVLGVLAWRIGNNFQETLDSVRQQLAEPRPVILQGPTTALLPEATPELPSAAPDAPLRKASVDQPAPALLESYEALELRLAEAAIEEGRFHAARMRLYRLLVNRDRQALLDETIAQAEFMIARSYLVQGEALGGTR